LFYYWQIYWDIIYKLEIIYGEFNVYVTIDIFRIFIDTLWWFFTYHHLSHESLWLFTINFIWRISSLSIYYVQMFYSVINLFYLLTGLLEHNISWIYEYTEILKYFKLTKILKCLRRSFSNKIFIIYVKNTYVIYYFHSSMFQSFHTTLSCNAYNVTV